MRDAAYFLAAVPEPVTCLGVRLKPLTLGHVILLHRFESAFATGDQPGFSDMVLSVAICSRSYSDALAFLDSRRANWLLKWWGFKTWIAVKAGHNISMSVLQFKRYFDSANIIPPYEIEEQEGTGRVNSTPFVLTVKVALQSKLGHTEQDAISKPWGAAIWEYMAERSQRGDFRLLSDAEVEETKSIKSNADKIDWSKFSHLHRGNN